MVLVRTYLSVKSLGSARAQAGMLSWIVDIYILIPYPHCVTRSNLDLGYSSSSAQVDYYISIIIVQNYTGKYHKFVAVCIVTSAQHE